MVEENDLSHVDAITYESLRLILGDIMAPVVDLEIQESPNQHGKLSVTIIAEEPVKDYILYEGNNDIAVLYMQNGEMKALFQGILINMRVMAAGEVYYVFMEVITASYLLDYQVHNGSFQDIGMTSHQMIKLIMNLFPGSQMLISIPDEPVGMIAVMYQETVWDFLKRFLSRYGAYLYVDSMKKGICLCFGLQDTKESVSWDHLPYVIKRDIAPKDVEKQLKGQLVYCVESYDVLPLGTQVLFHGKELYIGTIYRGLRNGLLVNQYHLYFKEGLRIKTYYNPNISGISVKGVVTNIMRNQVQVRLQIDALKSYQNQYFYPYSSVAASPDGGGWYCMPKPGDPVRIFFPVSDESKGYAISSVQGESSPASDSPMGNPDLKDITTPDGKTVKFIENGILLSVGEGNGSVTLTNDGKAEFNTKESIIIGAGEEIKITTDGELTLSAGTQATFTSEAGSSINLTDDTIEANASIIWNN